MSYINDGGSAFPCGSYDPKTGCEQPPVVEGMSLRAWFAGQALGGLLSDPAYISMALAAETAVEAADAIIAKLNEGNQ
jgi:hypothetical protein